MKISSTKWNCIFSWIITLFFTKISFRFMACYRSNGRHAMYAEETNGWVNRCRVWWWRIYWCTSNDVGRLIRANTWPVVSTYQLLTITFALFICEKMAWLRHAECFPCFLPFFSFFFINDIAILCNGAFPFKLLFLQSRLLLKILRILKQHCLCILHFFSYLLQFRSNTGVSALFLPFS